MYIRRCLATKILVEVERLYGSFGDAWRVSWNRYDVALAAFMIGHSSYLYFFHAVLMLFWPRSRFADSQALWADSLVVEGNRDTCLFVKCIKMVFH
jgi:hypothetical protein